MVFLDSFFNTIFGFLLDKDPLIAIISISFVISLIVVIIYRLLTNQKEMKELKTELKDHQKKMKEHKNDTEKMMKLQKKAMQTNMKYMGKSMKPTLITFLPIILIFGWLNAHFAYEPLHPGVPFEVTAEMEKGITGNVSLTFVPEGLEVISPNVSQIEDGKAKFELNGTEGDYYITLQKGKEKQDVNIIITNERKYAPVEQSLKSDVFDKAIISNKPLKVIFGLGWLWAYIISAIVFSIALRKLFRVH